MNINPAEVADAVKDSSAEAITRLRALGLTPILLTGDNRSVADTLASDVGIDEVIAEVMPRDKVNIIKLLQKRAARWPWSATASTTPPPAPSPPRDLPWVNEMDGRCVLIVPVPAVEPLPLI
ncbi:hypothetical protein ADL00_12460 [Streptomyces sp. AS58]|nr:hypothetical protein ADL00_12460 [Streptomyces sp. AS58]